MDADVWQTLAVLLLLRYVETGRCWYAAGGGAAAGLIFLSRHASGLVHAPAFAFFLLAHLVASRKGALSTLAGLASHHGRQKVSLSSLGK